jgi:hypothetical protein
MVLFPALFKALLCLDYPSAPSLAPKLAKTTCVPFSNSRFAAGRREA